MNSGHEPRLDRESLIGIGVCILLLVGWQLFVWKTQPPPPVSPPPPEATTTVAPLVAADAPVDASPTLPLPPLTVAAAPVTTNPDAGLAEVKNLDLAARLSPAVLENEFCQVTIDPNRGCVDGIVLKQHLLANRSAPVVLGMAPATGPGPLEVVGQEPWQTLQRKWSTQDERKLVLRRELFRPSDQAKFFLTQSWGLSEDYRVRYEVILENSGATELVFPELRVEAGSIEPIILTSGDKVFNEVQDIVYCLSSGGDYVKHRQVDRPGFFSSWFGSSEAKIPKGFAEVQENPVRWIGAANKYFACLLIPDDGFPAGNTLFAEPLPSPPATKSQEQPFRMGAAGFLCSAKSDEKLVALAPGATEGWMFTWYAGPQEIARLGDLAPATTQIMRLSWGSWLSWISRQLTVALIWLKDWCGGSYGLAIILLTVIVKIAFWPATHRANASMRKMQTIQPMIKELREKHAKDQQKLSAETMKLYREQGVNPFGGCLPILLQMPVFFALYGTLNGAIELRHAGFLWIHDLTLPDTVGHLPLVFATVPINPLMIAWGGSMLLQQHLTPSAADPIQQKMMLFMPIVMTVMFYNAFPGGLTLYWTVSQAISIAQLLHQRRARPDNEPAPPVGKKKPPTGKPRAAAA